jgi:pectate lyase
MKTSAVLIALAGFGAAQSVVGKAEGFAAGVTGGGSATPEYPETIEELTAMLTDPTPCVIVLSKEFDFTETEGTETGAACQNWGTEDACQKIIQDDCGSSPAIEATWFKAPRTPIDVASDKTILGVGEEAGIKGKGLRFTNGASNIIVQNIQITDLNPEFVWGGDAISFSGSDLIWIDHVTVSFYTMASVVKLSEFADSTNRPPGPAASTTCSASSQAHASPCLTTSSTASRPTLRAAATGTTTGLWRW